MLKADLPSAVHLWALYGIINACSVEPRRHVAMFRREGGFALLEDMIKHDKDDDVRRLVKRLERYNNYYEQKQTAITS